MTRQPDTLISADDVAALSISPHGQPYVITLAGLLGPGGFVDDKGRPDVERLRRELAARIEALAELTQRAVHRDGRWWWVDSKIDVAAHIVVDASGPEGADFGTICGRLAMTPLDATRPLWHLALVPEARDGHCGLVLRIHHMLVDGARVTAMLERLFAAGRSSPSCVADAGEDPAHVDPHEESRPSILDRARFRLHTVMRLRIRSRALLGPLGPIRDAAVANVDLAELQRAAASWGGTINDAYLVAAGQGMRLVIERGDEVPPDSIVISVPVQVPGTDGARNAVGFMLIDVPLTATDLSESVRFVAEQTRSAKRVARDAGPAFRAAWIARGLNWYAQRQRVIGAIASNVRGPRGELEVAGAPLVEIWPLGPLAGNLRVGFTAASYAGRFWVGVEVDVIHTPGADAVAARVEEVLRRIAEGHESPP